MSKLHHRLAATAVAGTLVVAGLTAVPAGAATTKPAVDASGSVEQVYVVGATPGAKVSLKRAGRTVDAGSIDDFAKHPNYNIAKTALAAMTLCTAIKLVRRSRGVTSNRKFDAPSVKPAQSTPDTACTASR